MRVMILVCLMALFSTSAFCFTGYQHDSGAGTETQVYAAINDLRAKVRGLNRRAGVPIWWGSCCLCVCKETNEIIYMTAYGKIGEHASSLTNKYMKQRVMGTAEACGGCKKTPGIQRVN